jgi:hypothetical protein
MLKIKNFWVFKKQKPVSILGKSTTGNFFQNPITISG